MHILIKLKTQPNIYMYLYLLSLEYIEYIFF